MIERVPGRVGVRSKALVSDGALDCEVVVTRAGAHAMLDRITGELMHPVVGPLVESASLYVQPSRLAERLRRPAPAPLVLFDVGLGAGSNALAAWQVSETLDATDRRLEIVSFDRSLEALRLASSPAHAAAFGFKGDAVNAARALAERHHYETARGAWRVRLGNLPDALAHEPAQCADVVYWDPFSPRANPVLWTVAAFAALRRVCRDGATVHTYSRATATRSALLLAGFAVGFGAITAGDKPTTIAAVNLRDVEQPLDRRWLQRLTRSSAPLPTDAPADALLQISSLPQFA